MPTILVDYENVSGSDGLKGVDVLSKNDTLIIFYSKQCEKIRCEYVQKIEDSGCEFKVVKLAKSGKNALDFYIAAECGTISERGEKQIVIISKDKGYQAVIDYLSAQYENLEIVKAGSVEVALTMFRDQENSNRRALLHKRMKPTDLGAECARIKEKNRMHEEIKIMLKESGYESMAVEIINLLDHKKAQGKKALYTSSLHCFGREEGRAIYRLVRDF